MNKKHTKTLCLLLLTAVLVCVAAACGSQNGESSGGASSGAASSQSAASPLPIDLGDGLMITEARRYAGIFMEDGTDQIVDSVMMLMVENNSEAYIQLAGITVYDTEGTPYNFQLTTLFPGEKAALLELDRALWDESIQIVSAELTSLALFDEAPSMHPDLMEFQREDYQLRVKNISDQAFSGGRVCYKSVSGDIYIGGITYTVTIPALAPGEETTLSARHYLEGGSRLIFVTYAE